MQMTEMMLSQRPGVVSARGAKQWLKSLPLSDARSSHHAIATLLLELAESPPPPRDRLEILETIRVHAFAIDQQYALRFAGKPLPLGPLERNAYNHAQAQWRGFAAAYLGCFEASLDTTELAPLRALCLVRAGGYFCAALRGMHRAGQAGAGDLIDDLQRLVELANEYGLADQKVRDSSHPRACTSVTLVYHRAILIGLAAATAAGKERDALFDLATFWEGKIACTTLPRGESRALTDADLPAADTARKRRLRLVRFGRQTHIVDMSRLARSIARRLRRLEAGAGIEELRLPDPLRNLPAREMLARAQQAWCDRSLAGAPPAPVAPGARQAVALSYVAGDFSSMYCMVSGQPFTMHRDAEVTSRRNYDELFVFQHAALARNDSLARETVRNFEDWEILAGADECFRLGRGRPAARFRNGQLVAMRMRIDGDDGPVTLAEIARLEESSAEGRLPGAIDAEVKVLRGKPHAVAVRDTSGNREARSWCPAFRLGSLHAHDSVIVILPAGWFKPDRALEMHDTGAVHRLRLASLKRRGRDYEQVEAVIVR